MSRQRRGGAFADRAGDYDAIAIELCDTRFRAMRDREAWRNLDLLQIIRDGKAEWLLPTLHCRPISAASQSSLALSPAPR